MSDYRRHFGSLDLLYDEKFEVWLNLSPIIKCCETLHNTEEWKNIPKVRSDHTILNVHTVRQLQCVYPDPRSVVVLNDKLASITPLLPAVLLDLYLRHRDNSAGLQSRPSLRDELQLHSDVAIRTLELQLGHLLHTCSNEVKSMLMSGSSIWKEKLYDLPAIYYWAAELSNWFNVLMLHHKQSLKNYKYKPRILTNKIFAISAVITSELIILETKTERYICHQALFLECHNKLQEMTTMLLFNWLQDGTSMPNGHLSYLIEYISHCVSAVLRYKNPPGVINLHHENQGFLYLKSLEGLGVAEIIRRTDKEDGLNDTLWKSLWKNLQDDKIAPMVPYYESSLYNMLASMPIPTLSDAMGTVKVCGHPSIEIEEGLQDLYKKTHENIMINQDTVSNARGMMIRELTKNFYNKHKNYPIFEHIPDDPALKHILFSPLAYKDHSNYHIWKSISLKTWNQCEFGKNAEFDFIDHGMLLLKDRAACRTRASFLAEIKGESRLAVEETKVLLQYLMSDDNSGTREYIERYMEDDWGDEVLNYLVIKLTAKELEFKYKGRFFGASPIYERNRRIIQESNITRLMAHYIPDQLLTPPELSIIKKLMHYRTMRTLYPDSVVLNISFDFSSWNNRMRSGTVDVAANVLDGWFGVKLYGKTMKAFQHALVIYKDGKFVRQWIGQEGGIEGLNQATWSWVFIGGMRHALEKTGFKYQITVKGDDVRAALVVPKNTLAIRSMDNIKSEIMSNIQELCAHVGWKLNPNECYISRTLMSTSKSYFVNDVHLPNATKKFMRSEGNTNIPFPTLEDTVGTCFSIAHSVCYNSTSIFPAYLGALLQATKAIHASYKNKPEFNSWKTSRCVVKDFLVVMLCWPQVIGGPGSLPLQTFLVRGENDMLSVSVSLMRYILFRGSQNELQSVVRILNQKIDDRQNFDTMLLGDPYAIPLSTPPRPQSLLKQMMRKAMRRITKQTDVKQLLDKSISVSELKFKRTLLSMDPYYPKVATTIWENSPYHLIEQLLAKILNSTTIISMFLSGKRFRKFSNLSYKTVRLIVHAELARKRYWYDIIFRENINNLDSSSWFGVPKIYWLDPGICSTQLTKMIRSSIWKRELVGITYPSLVDQGGLSTLTEMKDPNYILSVASLIHLKWGTAETKFGLNSLHYANSLGDETPWLGHTNTSGIEASRITSDVITPQLSKVVHLMEVLSVIQGTGSTQVCNLIISMLNVYTGIPFEELAMIIPIQLQSDNKLSKLQINSYSRVTMPNYKFNLGQLVRIQDTYKSYTNINLDKRTINHAARHFFAVAISSIYIAHDFTRRGDNTSWVYLFHMSDSKTLCPHCFEILQDQSIVMSQEFTFDDTTKHIFSNRLITCGPWEKDALKRDIAEAVIVNVKRSNIPKLIAKDDSVHTLTMVLTKAIEEMRIIKNNLIELDTSGKLQMHHLQTLAVDLALELHAMYSLSHWYRYSERQIYEACFQVMLKDFAKLWFASDILVWFQAVDLRKTTIIIDKLADLLWLVSQHGLLTHVAIGYKDAHNNDNIKWMHNLMDDKEQLANSFLRAHWSILPKQLSQFDFTDTIRHLCFDINDDLELWLTQQHKSFIQYKLWAMIMCMRALNFGVNIVSVVNRIKSSSHDPGKIIMDMECRIYIMVILWFNQLLQLCDAEDIKEEIELHPQASTIQIYKLYTNVDMLGDGDLNESLAHSRENVALLSHLLDEPLDNMHSLLYALHRKWNELLVEGSVGPLLVFERFIDEVKEQPNNWMKIEVVTGSLQIPLKDSQFHIIGSTVDMIPNRPSACNDMCSRVIDQLQLSSRISTPPKIQTWDINSHKIVSMVDATRIVGVINKSIARYAWIWNHKAVDAEVNFPPDGVYVVLGDGGGSISRFILESDNTAQVIYSSLTGNTTDVYDQHVPIEMMDDPSNPIWLRLHVNVVNGGDIMSNVTFDTIKAMIVPMNRSVRCVISDADFLYNSGADCNDNYVETLHHLILRMYKVSDPLARIIVRITHFESNDLRNYLYALNSCIVHFHVCRNPYSQLYSYEWFLVMENSVGDHQRLSQLDISKVNYYMYKSITATNVDAMLTNSTFVYQDTKLNDLTRLHLVYTDFERLFELQQASIKLRNNHLCHIIAMLQNMFRPEVMSIVDSIINVSPNTQNDIIMTRLKTLLYTLHLSLLFIKLDSGNRLLMVEHQLAMILNQCKIKYSPNRFQHTLTEIRLDWRDIRKYTRESKKSYVRIISWLCHYARFKSVAQFRNDPKLTVAQCCIPRLTEMHGCGEILSDQTNIATLIHFTQYDTWVSHLLRQVGNPQQ
uniref:RNA-directed RNA polymerase n=1 Tax=Shuangao Insect Virus 5 TaxID=1608079 RepID=A0A0B5KXA8_9VIRU|nr:polymerase [Shuangao Insect Virus 5]